MTAADQCGPERSRRTLAHAAGPGGEGRDGWAPRGIRVELADDEEIRHCSHCDRYSDDNPLAHPSCLIVKKLPESRP
jgi:hypothetical protein